VANKSDTPMTEAVVEAAARDEATRRAYTELDEQELGWILEDVGAALGEDPDPTPPSKVATAWRDSWLRQRVDAQVRKSAAGLVANVFCKTGQGGGIDPTCGAGKGGAGGAQGRKSLTLEETDAVNVWMLNAWGRVKQSQRDGTELGQNFNSALKKLPPAQGESYRGLATLKDDDRYEVGKVVHFKTSESFSSNKEFASGWAEEHPRVKGSLAEGDREPIVLVMPKSGKLRVLATTQDEVVHLPGMTAKVARQEVVGGIKYVYFDQPE
jgi:hypothetical protein